MTAPTSGGDDARLSGGDLLPFGILLAAIVGFVYGWTLYGWQLYLSLRLPVFDFGINYQVIWAAAHGTELDFFGIGIGSLVVYAFVPSFWLIGSEPSFFLFLIAFEAAWLALGAVPLFFVARERLRSRWAALALALAYLAFPALAGPVWFPFHFEALFPTLFLFGYWMFRRGTFWAAGAFWTACLFTHIGAVIVMGFFAAGIVLEPRLPIVVRALGNWTRRRGSATDPLSRPARPYVPSAPERLGVYLFIASVAVFLIAASYYGWFWFLHYITKTGPNAVSLSQPLYSAPAAANLPVQGWTLLLLFGPLLALPFLGREERWGMIPYMAMLLLTSQHGFWFPFRNQYPALLVGPLFAATVRGIERLRSWGGRREPSSGPGAARGPPARRPWLIHRIPQVTAGVVLGLVVVSGLFIAPWGPFNAALRSNGFLAAGYYNDSSAFGTNLTLDAEIRALAESVPAGGVVLTQTELVEPLNREYYMVPSRFTPSVPLNYLLTDPYNPSFYGHSLDGPYSTTMEQWANYYLAEGWGILGEVDGALLLAGNYSGTPKLFDPVDQWFGAASFPCCGTPNSPWNGSTHGPWTAGPSTPYDGNYNVFSPGRYNLTLSFAVAHPRASDRILCQVTGNKGQSLLWTSTISGAGWTAANGTVQVTVPIDVPNYELGPRVSLHVAQWTGSLQFLGLHVRQTAPPFSWAGG
jgi:uncharacterized membrane protein